MWFGVRRSVTISAVLLAVSSIQPARAASWQTCAAEGQFCRTPYATTVRYGANGVYAFQQTKGGVLCSNSVFGDPLFNVRKSCQFQVAEGTPKSLGINVRGRTVTGNCAARSLEWKKSRGAKAFAITDDGGSCGWQSGAKTVAEAQSKAVNSCRARFLKPCTVVEFSP